jgi:hypothetical protein
MGQKLVWVKPQTIKLVFDASILLGSKTWLAWSKKMCPSAVTMIRGEKVIVYFVDIGGIIDHLCLNFLFIILSCKYDENYKTCRIGWYVTEIIYKILYCHKKYTHNINTLGHINEWHIF